MQKMISIDNDNFHIQISAFKTLQKSAEAYIVLFFKSENLSSHDCNLTLTKYHFRYKSCSHSWQVSHYLVKELNIDQAIYERLKYYRW